LQEAAKSRTRRNTNEMRRRMENGHGREFNEYKGFSSE